MLVILNCTSTASRALEVSLKLACVLILGLLPTAIFADDSSSSDTSAVILNRYLTASESQAVTMRGMQMDVDIDAKLPKLKKEGKLNALRFISHIGKISYVMRSFVGDNTIKKDVIARYLNAETQAQLGTTSLAITPENYKFKYKGLHRNENQGMHVYQVTPIKKRVGLFKGELWIDAATYLPLRESGRFVKNPSVFLKKVEFTRDYEIRDGVAIPRTIDSVIDTRLVGRAEIHIAYTNVTRHEADDSASLTGADDNNPR